MKKLKTFDSSYFIGKIHFEEDGVQRFLVFQPMQKYVLKIVGAGSGNFIYYWKCKGLYDERINSITASNRSITPQLSYYGTFEISRYFNISSYPTLENCLFGAVSLNKYCGIAQYIYSGYGIGFDRKKTFSFGNGTARNCIIVRVDTSSSAKIDNRKKDILIPGKGLIQGLEQTLTAEKLHSINFTEYSKGFCLKLYYNGANLFANGTEIIKFKARDSEIVAA